MYTPSRHPRVIAVPAAALLVAGLASGCSGSGSSPAPSPSASAGPSGTAAGTTVEPSTSAAPSASASANIDALPSEPAPSSTAVVAGPSAAEVAGTGEPAGPNAAVVKTIRMADHGTFDRVVIEFTGTFGAWNVAYVPKVISDPEGKEVQLAGSAYVAVRVQKATFDNGFQSGSGVPHVTYTGPRRMTAGLASVREIADAGDFEAVLGLGIGVAGKKGVRAFRLADPSRLVIDIAH